MTDKQVYDPNDVEAYYVCGTKLLGMRDDVPAECRDCTHLTRLWRVNQFAVPVCGMRVPR